MYSIVFDCLAVLAYNNAIVLKSELIPFTLQEDKMSTAKMLVLVVLVGSLFSCQSTGSVPATTPMPVEEPGGLPLVVSTPVPPDYDAMKMWGLEPDQVVTVVPLPATCLDGEDGALALAAIMAKNITLDNLVPSGLSPDEACLAYVGHQMLRRALIVPLLYEGITKLVATGPELISFDGNHGAAMVKVSGKILVYIFGSASLLTSFDTTAARVSILLPKTTRLARQPAALATLFECMKRAFDKVKDPATATVAKQLAEKLYKDNSATKFAPVPVQSALQESIMVEISIDNVTLESSEYAISFPAEYSYMTQDEIVGLVAMGILVVTAVVVFTCVTTGCTSLIILAPAALSL